VADQVDIGLEEYRRRVLLVEAGTRGGAQELAQSGRGRSVVRSVRGSGVAGKQPHVQV
jgi:hypothetical protein